MRDPAVDTYGLPIYKVTKIIKQRVGDEIHFLCGAELFGQMQWCFICTMKASDVIVEATEARAMAIDAFNDLEMCAGKGHC